MTANKIKKALKGNKLQLENVRKILYELGYSVIFFNTYSGDLEIERYNLHEEKNKLRAFSYSENARIVFINNNLSAEDKLYSALHELGHIALGHLQTDITGRNKILMDIEADNFAYSVIYRSRNSSVYILLSAIILSASVILGAYITTLGNNPEEVSELSQPVLDTVYVTPSGTKYHRSDCFYVKDKTTTIKLSIEEAGNKYLPCSVCNPQ